MKRTMALLLGLVLLASGCATGAPASAPPTTAASAAGTSTTPTPTATPTPTPALGVWKATCTAADADAAALVANLTALPAFAGKATPSAEPGWAEAVAAAVVPLDECQTSHLLAVSQRLAFGADADAASSVGAAVVALAKGRTLLLTGTQIGRITRGTSKTAAAPVLTAIMGTPETSTQSCEVSGESWDVLAWGDFRVSFLRSAKGAVLDGWSITPQGSTAANLRLQDDLPLQATFAQLEAANPGITQVDAFGTGAGPWIAEVRLDLRYHWTTKAGQSLRVEGGPLRTCE